MFVPWLFIIWYRCLSICNHRSMFTYLPEQKHAGFCTSSACLCFAEILYKPLLFRVLRWRLVLERCLEIGTLVYLAGDQCSTETYKACVWHSYTLLRAFCVFVCAVTWWYQTKSNMHLYVGARHDLTCKKYVYQESKQSEYCSISRQTEDRQVVKSPLWHLDDYDY